MLALGLSLIRKAARYMKVGGGGVEPGSRLLLEDGVSFLLLEDGVSKLLLE